MLLALLPGASSERHHGSILPLSSEGYTSTSLHRLAVDVLAEGVVVSLHGDEQAYSLDSGFVNQEVLEAQLRARDVASRLLREELPLIPVRQQVMSNGSSAGLAVALFYVEYSVGPFLPEDFHVAATGELSATGRVRPIGSLDAKLDAVKAAGLDAVVVPSSQTASAKEALSGSRIEIIPARSLPSAVVALCELTGESGSCSEIRSRMLVADVSPPPSPSGSPAPDHVVLAAPRSGSMGYVPPYPVNPTPYPADVVRSPADIEVSAADPLPAFSVPGFLPADFAAVGRFAASTTSTLLSSLRAFFAGDVSETETRPLSPPAASSPPTLQ